MCIRIEPVPAATLVTDDGRFTANTIITMALLEPDGNEAMSGERGLQELCLPSQLKTN